MRKFILLLTIFLVFLSANSFSTPLNQMQPGSLIFEVVQERFVFDHSSVASASIIERKNGTYGGLHVTLKPTAAKIFESVSAGAVNKQVNLVFNNKIVSITILKAPLQDNLLIAGIAREDAQTFIDALRHKQ